MSGDASLYVRGKAQERQGSDAKFMMDGFDRWAESEAPSRVGGADKMGNDEIYGEGRRRRHRSSKAIHSYADKHERSLEGAGRRRVARMRGHKVRSRSPSSSSDYSDSSHSSDSSESSVGRRGGALKCKQVQKKFKDTMTGMEWPYSTTECSDDSDSSSSSSSSNGKGRRRRGRRGGFADTVMRAMKASSDDEQNYVDDGKVSYKGFHPGYDDGKVSQGFFKSGNVNERQREECSRLFPKEMGSTGSGSDSDEGSKCESIDGVMRCRKGRGGPDDIPTNGTPRQWVNWVIDTWYNYKPSNFVFAGTPLSNWSLVPQKMKDLMNKLNEIWGMIEGNAQTITDLKQFMSKKAPKLSEALTRLGFGRKHRAKMLYAFLQHGKRQLRRGGDAFDDKLKSIGADGALKTLTGKWPTAGKIANAVRPLYNAYTAVAENADIVKAGVEYAKSKNMPGVDKLAPIVERVVDKAVSLKQQGLGRKGKRAPSQRNMMVAKMMREKGMSLGEASKAVSAMMKRGGGEL